MSGGATDDALYRELVERAPDGIVIVVDGKLVYVNQRLASLVGYSVDELLGTTATDYVVAHLRGGLLDVYRRRLAGEPAPSAYETEFVAKDGSRVPVENTVSRTTVAGRPAVMGFVRDIRERRQAAADLHASQERYRYLVETAPVVVLTLGRDARILDANPEAERVYGRSRSEMLGLDYLATFVPEAVRQAVRRSIDSVLAGDTVRGFENPVYDAVGGERVMLWSVTRFVGSDGAAAGIVAIGVDVTEQRRTQLQLRERDELVRALVETSQDWIWAIDVAAVHTYSNPAVEQILGYRADELVGKSSLELVHDEDRQRIDALLPQCIARRRGWRNLMVRWRHKDGSWRYLESNAVPVFGANGELIGFRGVDRDVTERLARDQELIRLASAVEQTDSAIFITGPTGIVEYVNSAYETSVGYSRDEAVGKRLEVLESNSRDALKLEQLRTTLGAGQAWRGHLSAQRRDGTQFEAETTVTPIRDRNGQVTHYVTVLRDVTREREIENQLRHTQRLEALGTLAGGVAHDFNNILGGIVGYAELAREDAVGNPVVVQALDEVLRGAERARQLVAKMSTFGRQRGLDRRPVRVKSAVEEVLALLRATLPATLDMHVSLAADCGHVEAEPTSLQQIVMNLCTNAHHAMPNGTGVLEVTVARTRLSEAEAERHIDLHPGAYVMLQVRDSGRGIPPEIQQRVFEPYFTTKEAGEGTGLGLAVVHSIVQQLGGAVLLSSQLGQGTEFSVYLPVLQTGSVDEHPLQVSLDRVRGDERVLIAEDEPTVRSVFRDGLQRLGYQVSTAANGPEALALLRQAPSSFDVVVTDLTMPGMTGLDVARQARQIAPGLPVILCTGAAERPADVELISAGISAVVSKPLTRVELAEELRQVLLRERGVRAGGDGDVVPSLASNEQQRLRSTRRP